MDNKDINNIQIKYLKIFKEKYKKYKNKENINI